MLLTWKNDYLYQGRRKIDNFGRGGHIPIFVFNDSIKSQFEKEFNDTEQEYMKMFPSQSAWEG